MRFLWKLELFALNSSFYKQIFKKKFGDSDKKAYLCSNKSHHASQRCVPRWDFAFYMGIWKKTNYIIYTSRAAHLSKPSTFISLIKNSDKELCQLIFKAIQDIEHTNCQNSYKCATQKSSCKRGITYRPDVIHYDYDRRKARFFDSTPRRVLHLLP